MDSSDAKDEALVAKDEKITFCQRLMGELVHSPFSILESDGANALDIQQSFAPHPIRAVACVKVFAFIAALDILILDLVLTLDNRYFYMAYLSHWALGFSVVYLFLSATNSLLSAFDKFPIQPPAGTPTTLFIRTTWALFLISVLLQILATIMHWILVCLYGPEKDLGIIDYMKHGGVLTIIILEGFVINRIPIRFRQVNYPIAVVLLYLVWILIHDRHTDIGNPNKTNTDQNSSDDDAIYSVLNWNERPVETGIISSIALLLATPLVVFFLVILSLPYRRYYSPASPHKPEQEIGIGSP